MLEAPAALDSVTSDADIVRVAVALGALETGGPLSPAEAAVVRSAPARAVETERVREAIQAGRDPLGTGLLALRSAAERRRTGAIYTPPALVASMVDWVVAQRPVRVVDAGAGSGRFSVEVARRRPGLPVVAIDIDPLATLVARATLAALGLRRVRVVQADYTRLALPAVDGVTAFVGNPPYVRHHALGPEVKAWARAAGRRLDRRVSGLAGLHALFFLATALLGAPRDAGCFVTSAEWLDVNYGAIVRDLLLGELGGRSIHVLEPAALPFPGATTTAAITCFRLGDRPPALRMRSVRAVEDVDRLDGGEPVSAERLAAAARWSPFLRSGPRLPEGWVELGDLCRVHRGAVTGRNAVWIVARDDGELPPEVLFPSVTRARELFQAGDALTTAERLKLVVDLPADLDRLAAGGRRAVERFLRRAARAGATDGYVARNRTPWWTVGLRAPAPILATYMARRPPAFVRNFAGARHVNIAHGLYPRGALPPHALDRLASALRGSAALAHGRTYAGGLVKFEPREMERLLVPDLPALLAR
jgi:adenine-specific DNA-methyltransferase